MNYLEAIAKVIRVYTVRQSYEKHLGHLGSCLSCVDVLVALYFKIMDWKHDKFVLSKGHAAPVLYQVLAEAEYFSHEWLDAAQVGEHLPLPEHLNGVEAATGSLGHGLPIAAGMALAKKIAGEPGKVYVLLGDGECDEGTIWEAAKFAVKHQLDNLVVVVDCNAWQATDRCISRYLDQAWQSFGWATCRVDGHDMAAVVDAFESINPDWVRPVAIIADTVKGKGVSFMEDDNLWHYRIPNEEEVAAAEAEIIGDMT
jgi:transketolase